MNDRIGQYCIIRTERAGVHCGTVADLGVQAGVGWVKLKDATRLWRWTAHKKAPTLALYSVALHGAGDDSRIEGPVEESTILGVIEVIPCTPVAKKFLSQARNDK